MSVRTLAVAALLGLACATGAAGHAFTPGILTLVEGHAEVYDVVWAPPSGEQVTVHPRTVLPPHCRWQRAGAAAAADTAWHVDCRPDGLRGSWVRLDGPAARERDVVLRIFWRDGTPFTTVLRSDQRRVRIPGAGGRESPLASFAAYVGPGIEHIAFGIDHLAFVLGLFLLVATGRHLVATITAFTLAHSISLALAVLDLVRLAAAPVEATIALSVLLLAVELTRSPTPPSLTRRRPWVVAFLFGLVHGLGFAGALRDFGLPTSQVPAALLGFNVGVEVGQLAFVAMLLACRRLLRPLVVQAPMLRQVPGWLLGIGAVTWTLDRLTYFWI